ALRQAEGGEDGRPYHRDGLEEILVVPQRRAGLVGVGTQEPVSHGYRPAGRRVVAPTGDEQDLQRVRRLLRRTAPPAPGTVTVLGGQDPLDRPAYRGRAPLTAVPV